MKTSMVVAMLMAAFVAAASPERVNGLETIDVKWRNAGPGGGGFVPSMLLSRHDPNRFWVGCDVGGVYLSEDCGRTYRTCNLGLKNLFINTICEHPTDADFLIVGSHGGIFITNDRGKSWRDIRKGLPKISASSRSAAIFDIRNVPGRPDSFWAMSGECGDRHGSRAKLFRSDDKGESWRQVVAEGQFDGKTDFRSLCVDPRDEKVLLLATSKGLYRSADAGVTWTKIAIANRSDRTLRLVRAPSDPNVVYLTFAHKSGETPWNSAPCRSADGGLTWKECGTDGLEMVIGKEGGVFGHTSSYKMILVSPLDPNEVYLCGATWRCEGVWKSTDGGRTWRHVFTKQHVVKADAWLNNWGPDIHSFTVSPFPPHALAFGTEGYVFRSEDRGETWVQRYTDDSKPGYGRSVGYETTCVWNIYGDPHHRSRFYFCNMDIGLQRSDDNGYTFKRSMKGVKWNDCFTVVFDQKTPDHLWGSFGTWGGSSGYLAESFDGGQSWKPLDGEGWVGKKSFSFTVDGECAPYVIRAVTPGLGLMVSRDGGAKWEKESTAFFPEPEKVVSISRVDGKYAIRKGGELWRGEKGGDFRKVFDLRIGGILGFDFQGESRILVCARERWTGKEMLQGGVWLSTDGGESYRRIYSDGYVATARFFGRRIVISPYDNPYHDRDNGGGCVITADDGNTWRTLNSDTLQNWNLTCYGFDPFDPSVLWAGTHGNALFVTSLPPLPAAKREGLPVWQPLGEPGNGGWIVSVEESPHNPRQVISGGDMLGCAVSFDGCESWKPGQGLKCYEMAQPTFHPSSADVVWIGSAAGPYISRDGGRTWKEKRRGMPPKSAHKYTAMVEKVLIDSERTDRLLAFGGSSRLWGGWKTCEANGTIWSSDDGGEQWHAVTNVGANIVEAFWGPKPESWAHAVTVDGNWYTSLDRGVTWRKRRIGGLVGSLQHVTLHPTDANIVWAVTAPIRGKDGKLSPGRIWKSVDCGRTFALSDNGIRLVAHFNGGQVTHFSQLAVSPKDPNLVFASDLSWAAESVYRSEDGGASWTKVVGKGSVPTALFAGPGCKLSVSPTNADVVYAYNSEYILKSADRGRTWADMTAMRPDPAKPNHWRGRGWNGWCTHDFVFNPYRRGQSILLGMDASHGWISDDGLKSWHYARGNSHWTAGNGAAFSKDGYIYIVTGQGGHNIGVLVSADGGESWQTCVGESCGLPSASAGEYEAVVVKPEDGKCAAVAFRGKLFRTSDGGANWRECATTVPVGRFAMDPTKSGRYYMKSKKGVFVTEDLENYTDIGLDGASEGRIFCDAKGRVYVCRFKAKEKNGLWRYEPQSKGWSCLNGVSTASAVACDPKASGRIVLVTKDYPYHDDDCGRGVFVSVDDGLTWTPANDGLHCYRLDCCAFDPFDPERVVLGTGGSGFVTARWPVQ